MKIPFWFRASSPGQRAGDALSVSSRGEPPARTTGPETLTLEGMQLRNARLCLDCDEVHADPECPVCASERFAFLTRWVPAEERRQRPRPSEPRPALESEDDSARLRWVKRGAAGVALVAVGRWLWHQSKSESSSQRVRKDGPDTPPARGKVAARVRE